MTKNQYSYSDNTIPLKNNVQFKWNHGFSKIFRCLRKASLTTVEFEEYSQCFYEMLPGMKKGADGYWRLKKNAQSIPLMFSIVAQK